MRLRSGTTLWSAGDSAPRYQALRRDISCDIAIVGAGVVGAMVAHELAGRNQSVVLVDKRPVGAGSTSASTALLMYQLDVHLTELIEQIGRRRAERIYRLSHASIGGIRRLVRSLGSGCGYAPRKVLYLAASRADARLLEREHRALHRLGFRVRLLDAVRLEQEFGVVRPAALVLHEAAQIDPVAFTTALVRRAHRRGVRVHTGIAVDGYTRDGEDTVLTTRQGPCIRARHVVMATGYESQQYLRKKIVRLQSSYVIASEPLPALKRHWVNDYLVWETRRPYLYVRTSADHRVLVGGEDRHIVDARTRDRRIPAASRRLKASFEALVPGLEVRTAYRWAGTFGETDDGVGYIGCPRELPGVHFALGFGGNGITFGLIAAQLLARALRGRPSADQKLFAFDR